MKTGHDLPPITVATCDYNRLMLTATIARRRGDPHAEFLLAELRRAALCRADDLPDDVISTNCRVIYRTDDAGAAHARLLVHPDDLKRPGAELSVTTPLGIALLGLRVGDRMPYSAGEESPEHEVVVEGVGLRLLHDITWRSIATNGSCDEPGSRYRQ